jgi:hypothetical protein
VIVPDIQGLKSIIFIGLSKFMGTWVNYFSTTGSIASGLTGLIFIGLSVNLKKILLITKSHVPSRSLSSLMLITNIVIVCNLCLVPGQSTRILGAEISVMALIVWFTTIRLDLKTYRRVDDAYKRHYLRNFLFLQVSILPFLIAGVFLLSGSEDAFYILVPGIIASLIKSLLDIWFLIVDLNRSEQ